MAERASRARGEVQVRHVSAQVVREAGTPARVTDLATRKLDAAEVPLAAGQTDEALPLVAGALLIAAARVAGVPVVAPEQASVWL